MGRQSQHCLEQSHQQHEVFGSHWVLPCLLQCPGCRIWSPTCPCSPQSSPLCPHRPCSPAACPQCPINTFSSPAPLPLAAPVPFAPIVEPPSSQFHAQDEFGQFSFGYQNINSAKTESKDAFGVTRGSYQYVD